jgi:nucleotide-binding universal stress UspA family protein
MLVLWPIRDAGTDPAGRWTMFERLLVPIDASAESLLALPPACRLAEATGARLTLLRIALASELALSVPGGIDAATRRVAEGRICPGDAPPAEEVILRAQHAGEIPALILAEARARAADLIVMATHARSGLDRLAHPSVAEAVLTSAPVPLLLVNAMRGQMEDGGTTPIVAAVDGTPEGAAALPAAVQYARALAAELLLLRVVTPQPAGADLSTLRYDPAVLGDAQHYLDRLTAQIAACGVPAQGRALFGPVAETIATVAEQVHANAIVLSTHSLRGMARLVHDSIADRLLRAETCPILLVRRESAWAAPAAEAFRITTTAGRPIGSDAPAG